MIRFFICLFECLLVAAPTAITLTPWGKAQLALIQIPKPMAPGLMELKPLGFAQLVYQIAIAEARCLQQLVPQGGP